MTTIQQIANVLREYHDRPVGKVWTLDFEEMAQKVLAVHPIPKHKEEYLQRVDQNANPEWKEKALQVVREICRTRPTFNSDDVWSELEQHEVQTHENRALGAILRRAAQAGLCEVTSEHVKSNRPESHRRPLATWRSCIYSPSPL